MKNRLPIISAILLIVTVMAGMALNSEIKTQKLETRVRLLKGKKKLLEYAHQAKRVWQLGSDSSIDQKCQDLDPSKYPDAIVKRARQCSIEFLNCWLKNLEGDIEAMEVSPESFVALKFSPSRKRAIFTLKDRASGFTQTYHLTDSCRDVYLPQNRYALGPLHPQNRDWQWDNFDKAIFIDKNPVSVRDVKEWLEWADFQDLDKPEISLSKEKLAPATNLLSQHQELFCAFHGGFVLPAHYYDAASFYPPVLNEGLDRIPRGPYPEGLRRQDSYLGLQLVSGETINVENLCRSFFSQECTSLYDLYAYSAVSLSWSGIQQVLGGEFENMINIREPKRNLKLSSKHYPMMSKWHEIGERGFWDGVGFEKTNFNWRTQDPSKDQESYGVAFRCARLGRVYEP